MVLRDSIGGNCKTRMVANVSIDPDDICKIINFIFQMRVCGLANLQKEYQKLEMKLKRIWQLTHQ